MKIDVYKKYDFKYNEKVFMENLKNELIQKGYNTLGEFHIIDRCFITKEEVLGHLKTRSQNCPLKEIK